MLSPFEIADKIFESQNIQTFIFKEPYDGIERFDNGLRREFFTQEDYGKISRIAD
ncbi:hypothetical protein [Treponema zioleckii]|uniref:hypothetical protein n=1 Tax=Treponema zioleckii TaxID=331680 RepID=UPI00168B38BC|nr:hypothetical protein [Treponema zioleckii]